MACTTAAPATGNQYGPLYCYTGAWQQQQQQPPPPPMQQPVQQLMQLQLPQYQQYPQYSQQQQQTVLSDAPRYHRPDLGYESDSVKSEKISASSPDGHLHSPCDSARPESPAAASDTSDSVDQLAEDVAGFRVAGGPRPVDMALSQMMQVVWHERFIEFFSRLPYGSWHLMPVFDPPDVHNTGVPRNQWQYCRDQAKVRFICSTCHKAWTSMSGQVVFWLYKDDTTNQAYVHFKLYGQKCTACDSEYYEHAIWYQEEVEKVIENLYHHVSSLFYGMPKQRRRVDRRAGHPKKEHSAATCQACKDRVCRKQASATNSRHHRKSAQHRRAL